MTRERPNTISIASSDRARIPFSIVGVLLLLTSVTIVVTLDSRADPSTDVAPAKAMDQASATTQSLLREAASDAMKSAAEEPVTVPAETPAGRAIESSGGESVFRRYAKLRVYLELQDRLRTSSFESNGARTQMSLPAIDYSESSIEDAIDRVSLTAGSDPGAPSGLEPGTVEATVEDVRYEVAVDGDTVGSRTSDVTVSVGSTTFLLHEKVGSYQDKLQTSFFDGDGFGRQFAARLYPVMYGKAYYERMSPVSRTGAFKKLAPKKDTVVLANSAIYALQRQTFGTEDPAADNLKFASYSCFGARNLQKILKATGKSGSRSKAFSRYGVAQKICAVGGILTGGASGSPPSSIQEVVNGMLGKPGGFGGGGGAGGSGALTSREANAELTDGREVKIDKFADPAFDEVRGNEIDLSDYRPSGAPEEADSSDEVDSDTEADLPDGDISNDAVPRVVDQIYSVGVDVSTGSASKVSGSYPDADSPSGSDWTAFGGSTTSVVGSDVDVDHTETWRSESGRTRTFHEFTVTVTNDIEETQDWRRETTCATGVTPPCYEYDETDDTSTVTFEVDVTVTATHSDSSQLDVSHDGLEHAYESGGEPSSLSPGNFEETATEAIEEGINVGSGDPEGNLESAIDADGIERPSGLQSEIDGQVSDGVTLDASDFLTPSERSSLESWLRDELEATHERLKASPPTGVDSIEVSVAEMATGSDVFEGLRTQIVDRHGNFEPDRYRYDVSGRYSSAPRKALVELRLEYLEDVREWMERVESARQDSTDDANSQMEDATDGATDVLNRGMDFASEALESPPSTSTATVEDTPLLGDVSYSVDGSPSYLTLNPVTRQTSPAVRPEHRSVDDVADSDHAPMSVRKHNLFGHPGMPLIPWPTYWYLSVDYWDVEVNGEYARFEVSASHDDPSGTKTTTYVRQAMPVDLEIAGQQRRVGEVDPIDFTSSTGVVVAVPGATVQPKPKYGVGDEWHYSSSSSIFQNSCSSTWPHAGPDFSPGDVNYEDCDNLQEEGESTLQQYLPGSDTVEEIPLEVEDDGDVELEDDNEGEFNDECDEPEDLKEELEDDAQDWFEDYSDDAKEALTDAYCSFDEHERYDGTRYRAHFEYLLETDEDVAEDWKDVVKLEKIDSNEVRRTMQYLLYDADDDGDPLGEQHTIDWFDTAHEVNEPERNDDNTIPPHSQPGIVTHIETNDDVELARVYGSRSGDSIDGSFLARPEDVRYLDRWMIVQDLALLDVANVNSNGAKYYPWGDYQCLGKAVVPSNRGMSISYTGSISAEQINGLTSPATADTSWEYWGPDDSLSGGQIQFELDDSDRVPGDNWIPLGTIEALNEDMSGDTFDDLWDTAATGENHATGTECA
ncbi:DUF7286 family protein [Halosimplex salinum]|uniref:DUF7286 family protein n=1 Tax=Halosimplex salinum TaxID=1710538 RepID=UPI000F49C960|nr:hypothetical protein [Halosimplex salinum]